MIIKNILASVTLLLVAFASRGQNIDSLNELVFAEPAQEKFRIQLHIERQIE